ncbi:solute:sodium symporter family transporter [Lentisphaerota bacterium WC36G]|nr:solute:sodium symporter family transporter [Lentisphaerae bacterium WC36]
MGMFWLALLICTGLVGVITLFITRRGDHKSSEGFYLGGRSLTWPVIAGSLLLTNLSTEQMVGLNGAAFVHGFHVMVWEVVAVIALVMMALYFLPRFLRSGISTIPELLEIRFDKQTRTVCDFIFLGAYIVILFPIILYTGAKCLDKIIDVQEITGITSQMGRLYVICAVIAILGAIYALVGGLKTVAVADTLNGILLLAGGFLVAYLAFDKLGGENGGVIEGFKNMQQAITDNPKISMNSMGGPNDNVPFFTIFSGVMLINAFYWCTNQQIIQRTLGASSLAEGQKGVLFTGLLKLFGPFYLVFPGLIAAALFSTEYGALRSDDAAVYGKLVNHIIESKFVLGFFTAALMGAILSSFNGALTGSTTLFGTGVYKNVINKDATERDTVIAGKIFGIIVTGITICIAPLLSLLEGKTIFGYLQDMNAIYFIPIFAVVLVALFTGRVPAVAAKISLVGGILLLMGIYFLDKTLLGFTSYIHWFYIVGYVFALLIVFMLVMGDYMPRKEEFIYKNVEAVDMTPWKKAPAVGLILVVIVVIIYITFGQASTVIGDSRKNIDDRIMKTEKVLKELKAEKAKEAKTSCGTPGCSTEAAK